MCGAEPYEVGHCVFVIDIHQRTDAVILAVQMPKGRAVVDFQFVIFQIAEASNHVALTL